MTREVVVASPETSLADALALLQERRIRHLPVVEGGALVGLVSDRDLRSEVPAPGVIAEAERQALLREKRVGAVMGRDMVVVDPDTPVEEAARLMAHHRIGCLPVVVGAEVVGILTASDLVRAFVELFGVNKPSSRLEVRMPNRPGELARVVRLIGVEERVNITGLVMPPASTTEVMAVIRVQTVDPRRIIEGLRRLGYEVGWPALDLPPEPPRAPAS
ncbi:MAG TPA: CBS and ACT domain-containing protein [Longimicrobiales bacterium]|nr:CBS and ACT domain-containing protein [Longimicrobiales bacterium]